MTKSVRNRAKSNLQNGNVKDKAQYLRNKSTYNLFGIDILYDRFLTRSIYTFANNINNNVMKVSNRITQMSPPQKTNNLFANNFFNGTKVLVKSRIFNKISCVAFKNQ